MALPSYAGPLETFWYYAFRIICGMIFVFLISPLIIIIPLSFNVEPYFSFSQGMLALDPDAFSLRWYEEFINSERWMNALQNTFIVAVCSTFLSMVLGTLAALGLSRSELPFKGVIMGLLISPMIVPLIISAAGMFFFYSSIGVSQSYAGLILAHTALGTPFVVITVTATLSNFDNNLIKASASLGATPTYTFFKITVPLIMTGVISGGLFAMMTSVDEVVVALFIAGAEQRTVPMQMWAGIREQISPTILAVATLLVCMSILLLTTVEYLRRRSETIRGITPH
ncbi:putative spermidine/putrescine transport system permease protein [Amphritea atlantica]|uniref:Putative spermidine/putrescine transport system permease protein n=1 Tax=Amphritea atlantica TaxID=355243 RepID=A0A1H9GTZ0_9GAMM|nr:ABC transporter permease [Amphritea atlantica]SEQ53530.1 putative spermidine/putrescine transport system permease protein [Amphritea atlantica]